MKILYAATKYSPLEMDAVSGSDYQFYNAFIRHGADVRIVGPFQDTPGLLEKLYRRLHTLISNKRYAKFSVNFLRQCAREVEKAAADYQPDIIFAKNVAPLVYLRTGLPVVYRLDTTMQGMQDQWPIFSHIEFLRMNTWEKRALALSRGVITHSTWTQGYLHKTYGVPARNILVFPDPASMPEHVVPPALEIVERPMTPLHLLLVGREYRRKGIDIAIQVAEQLEQAGTPVELRIVGLQGEDRPSVRYMGTYNKSDEAQLQQYVDQYRWAHFLIHPARFEPAGRVQGEAAAYGLPTLTNASGGLATTVEDGVSGVVLPKDSPAEAYVRAIQYYLASPSAYLKLCRSSRKRYEDELNWDVAGRQVMDFMQQVLENSKRPV